MCLALSWAQGPFESLSELQVIELIHKARGYSDPEAYRAYIENDRLVIREFFSQYEGILNALGKRRSFYYLRMIDLNDNNRYGDNAHLAFASRINFWMFREEYSEAEIMHLERARNFLTLDPSLIEEKDKSAKLLSESFLSKHARNSVFSAPDLALAKLPVSNSMVSNTSVLKSDKSRVEAISYQGKRYDRGILFIMAAFVLSLVVAIFIFCSRGRRKNS